MEFKSFSNSFYTKYVHDKDIETINQLIGNYPSDLMFEHHEVVQTIICDVIEYGDDQLVEHVLTRLKLYSSKGISTYLNLPSNKGLTPLNLATYYGRINVVKLLLEHGVDTEFKDTIGPFKNLSALDLAIQNNHVNIAVELIQHDVSNRLKAWQKNKLPDSLKQDNKKLKLLVKEKELYQSFISQDNIKNNQKLKEKLESIIDGLSPNIANYVGYSLAEAQAPKFKTETKLCEDGFVKIMPLYDSIEGHNPYKSDVLTYAQVLPQLIGYLDPSGIFGTIMTSRSVKEADSNMKEGDNNQTSITSDIESQVSRLEIGTTQEPQDCEI
ncbi:hypothetical protein phytr_2910 [Candidatus Phycorickettsia trachydisci]|uniref:Uncharacterized protein n=1 Tax=Candidatus Phycorickettsia trachydisci TaxID=2115978 RepID=A0A2P1P7J8_9RICK|nr:ankyrin repeat domain-containing protein [Candidatus Phycorickettsia trachydisci]AVP87247.1 hypothetical protein phytr_2910 [Candidatus Phycorickettsia trachydisci]